MIRALVGLPNGCNLRDFEAGIVNQPLTLGIYMNVDETGDKSKL